MDASSGQTSDVLNAAMELVEFLRSHDPWDRRQTPRTLAKHLIEEAHEVVDAIVSDEEQSLPAELGDLLLNLAFQLVIGEETGRFDRTRVWRLLEDKMQRRHPHLFDLGDEATWEEIKSAETPDRPSVLDGIPTSLPPLSRAYATQRAASAVGFDWDDAEGALDKVKEETGEVASLLGADPAVLEEEIGDLLFSVVNLARLAAIDPAVALTSANRKFERRFRQVEEKARTRRIDLQDATLAELDLLWDEVKASEAGQ